VAEKRRIVELTMVAGASVATVARAEGVNANQVFEWRRAYRGGRLNDDGSEQSLALLPVVVSHGDEVEKRSTQEEQQASACGTIHVELPGRALISVEGRADAVLLRAILESLRK
jgi:transposase